jgi:hypothetical protein
MTATDGENAAVRTRGIRILSFTPEDEAKFKVEFGIPPDELFAGREIDGRDVAPKMEGSWTLRVFGIPLSLEEFATFPADPITPIHVSCEFTEQDGVKRIHIMNDLSDSPEVREFFETRRADLSTLSTLIMYSARLYHRAAPHVSAELRWHPVLGFRASIGGLQRSDNIKADTRRAARAFPYFDDLQFVRRLRRRRLEESQTSQWRHYAEQAIELLRAGEVRSVRDAAARLMVDYDELGDDVVAERKAVRAAEVRLHRYIKKLREEEEKPTK